MPWEATLDLRWPRPTLVTAVALLAMVVLLAAPLAGVPAYAVLVIVAMLAMNGLGQIAGRIRRLERLLSTDEADIAALAASYPSASRNSPGRRGPIEAGIEDAIAGYQRAGYSEAEAKSMAREVLRIQVKDAGGWSA